jgi:serine/threonine protein kinase
MGKNLGAPVHCTLNAKCGTRSYMSPEVLKKQSYGYEVDVFAVAIIAYILLTGQHPFLMAEHKLEGHLSPGKKNTNIVSLKRLQYADWQWNDVDVSPPAKDFIEQLGREFPERRLALKNVLSHPFLSRKISICKQPRIPTVKQAYSDSTTDFTQQGETVSTCELATGESTQPSWVKDLQAENRLLKFELKLKLNPDMIGLEDEDLMPVNPVENYSPQLAMAHMLGMLA